MPPEDLSLSTTDIKYAGLPLLSLLEKSGLEFTETISLMLMFSTYTLKIHEAPLKDFIIISTHLKMILRFEIFNAL